MKKSPLIGIFIAQLDVINLQKHDLLEIKK